MDSPKGVLGMIEVCLILLPDRVGIFTDETLICQYVRKQGGEGVQWVDNEKVARSLIFDNFSIEELFLLGIDDTDSMLKNKWYHLPVDINGD